MYVMGGSRGIGRTSETTDAIRAKRIISAFGRANANATAADTSSGTFVRANLRKLYYFFLQRDTVFLLLSIKRYSRDRVN